MQNIENETKNTGGKHLRILKTGKMLFGKRRVRGETLPAELFYALDRGIQDALLGSEVLEIVIEGSALGDSDRETIHHLQAQVDALREKLSRMGSRLDCLELEAATKCNTSKDEDHPIKARAKLVRKPKKGDPVEFRGEGAEVLQGVVDRTKPSRKKVYVIVEGHEWELSYCDVTVLEAR